MRRSTLPAALLVLAVAATAPLASAQERGVTVDPDSPSGTEYAIPVERARDEASRGGGKPKAPGERSAPLFGEGIDADSDEDEAAAGGASGGGGDGGRGKDSSRSDNQLRKADIMAAVPRDLVPEELPRALVLSSAETDEAGLSGILLVLGLGVLTVALGLGAGLAIRRRRRGSDELTT
jgi:hypothetical protein